MPRRPILIPPRESPELDAPAPAPKADAPTLGVYLPEPEHCPQCGRPALVYYELRDGLAVKKCRQGHWLTNDARRVLSAARVSEIGSTIWRANTGGY